MIAAVAPTTDQPCCVISALYDGRAPERPSDINKAPESGDWALPESYSKPAWSRVR